MRKGRHGWGCCPQFSARYLNCIKLHTEEETLQAALMEIFTCYSTLIVAGLKTVRAAEDTFEITDETVEAEISLDTFEISGISATYQTISKKGGAS